MSVSAYRFVTITCDVCGEIWDYGAETRVSGARKFAKSMGWSRGEGGTDICPRHTAQEGASS